MPEQLGFLKCMCGCAPYLTTEIFLAGLLIRFLSLALVAPEYSNEDALDVLATTKGISLHGPNWPFLLGYNCSLPLPIIALSTNRIPGVLSSRIHSCSEAPLALPVLTVFPLCSSG